MKFLRPIYDYIISWNALTAQIPPSLPVAMPSAADIVLLSSTPDHKSTRTPQQVSHHSETPTGLSLQFDSPTSPSELFRQLHSPANATPQDTEKDAARKTTGKRAADKTTSDAKATENKPKRGRRKITDELQTVLTHVEPAALGSKDNAPKKAPKTRTKRANTNTEKKHEATKNKTLTGRVSKASSADSQQSDAKKPSSSKSSSQGGAIKDLDDLASGLQLEEATRRRLDWTPTKDTGKLVFDLEGDGDAGDSQVLGAAQNFSNLLAGYGFTGTASSQPSIQGNEDGGGPTKRRRIDLMDSRIQAGTNSSAKNKDSVEKESQQKPKKQNKKFTTLTARVTARYAPGYTEDSNNGSLNTADAQDRTGIENAGRKRKSKTKKKPQEPEFIVLSPGAAVKSLEDQDLMFGTCSQLEREDSPTTLRDMQTAINESEGCMEPMPNLGSRTSSASTISRFTGPRSLWSEAFRDLDGALAQAEVLDLVEDCDLSKISPRVDRERRDAQQQEVPKVVDQPVNTTHEKEASIPEGNSDALENSSQFADANANQQSETAFVAVESRPQMPQYSAFTEAELSKQVASYGFKAVRGRQKMIDLLQKCWESKHGTSATSNDDRQSSLDGSALTKPPKTSKDGKTTDASNKTSGSRSRSKVKSTANPLTADDTSAKPPARRRQGSSRPASRSLQKATESLPSQQQQKPPSQQKPSYADVEEIQDSEDEAIPSPNQLLSRYFIHPKPNSQPLAVLPTRRAPSISKTHPIATTTVSRAPEEDDEPNLGTQITKAVRAQPNMSSSTDGRKSPSWYEKIHMYDPIVLEDFTTWLNTEGLGLVSEDREVGAVLAKEWCESKGICCCYRNKSW